VAAPGFGAGYAPALPLSTTDTIRPKNVPAPSRTSGEAVGAGIPGYLSSWGLPPIQGQFVLTDTGLVFHSSSGSTSTHGSISLAYVEDENGRVHYVFRVDAGVFETDTPGRLLEVAAHPAGLSAHRPVGEFNPALVDESDPSAALTVAQQVAASPYADSLYQLFGRPRAAVGLVGARGRGAGRLGEYLVGRDSLAFDPARMTGEAQFRHALAHELGHRWQARARVQVATLWSGVPSIRDPRRYGYGDLSEHQAESIAFAVNFLQTTATRKDSEANFLSLLDHYELLIPGTRTMVRYFLLQPIYQHHPLRSLLTVGTTL
jgi:hypothetical protein